ncbi:hypothetical protein [Nocardiopsis lambiniae]|uniref:Ig-like domain-containing protein n=1 Tax=Nocardiopsis lambiniae TaxID=3075539 RepID=A0ABU2MHC7_9ACTN|nr:hypothetical protein [Nocardiopsis sp. DSM 44743]MDT0332101.1 hypothetical protein [Nocardiopsis sp. DSM 44743]
MNTMVRRVGGAASALLLSAGIVLGSAPAAGAEVEAQVNRKSVSCSSPSGNKVNFSWDNGGLVTTTLYYNNHCNHDQRVTVNLKNAAFDRVCLVTKKKTKTNIRYNATSISSVTKGCPWL